MLAPGNVDILVAARGKGQLSLALRGVNDHEVLPRSTGNFRSTPHRSSDGSSPNNSESTSRRNSVN